MRLITDEQRATLRAHADQPDGDPFPVVKFYNPAGPATWVVAELAADGDTLFGLADLGFGCPELGYFSLGELERLHLPFGLRIERDRAFRTAFPLSVWADEARRSGSLMTAEAHLARRSRDASRLSELPPRS